jgi:uncharacterized membrane protein
MVDEPPAPAAAAEPVRPPRIASIDIVRGAVMVLMAIDHVRVYSGVAAGSPDPGVFFTRWVTNFCAPAFFFLAGVGAFLHGQRLRSRGALARFLLTRGLWLVLLELTVIRTSWTFNVDFAHYNLAGVIWALGWSMVLLAPCVFLPHWAIATLGLIIIAGHNLLPVGGPPVQGAPPPDVWWLWRVLYLGGRPLNCFGLPLTVLYVLIPWVGVMAAGYAFGPIMRATPERRRRFCLAIGLGAIALFVLLRSGNLYGDSPWSDAGRLPGWMSFLATSKYPASLLFLLMTLGPTIAVIPLLERVDGVVARVLAVYGKVPLFYYLLHIPLIHAAALLLALLQYPKAISWLNGNQPMVRPPPSDYVWSLPQLYAVTIAVVALLYLPCRWLARLKARRRDWWLSFV